MWNLVSTQGFYTKGLSQMEFHIRFHLQTSCSTFYDPTSYRSAQVAIPASVISFKEYLEDKKKHFIPVLSLRAPEGLHVTLDASRNSA